MCNIVLNSWAPQVIVTEFLAVLGLHKSNFELAIFFVSKKYQQIEFLSESLTK